MTAEIMRSFQDTTTCSFSDWDIKSDEVFAVLWMSLNEWQRLLRVRRAENTETFIRLFRKVLHTTSGKYCEEMCKKF